MPVAFHVIILILILAVAAIDVVTLILAAPVLRSGDPLTTGDTVRPEMWILDDVAVFLPYRYVGRERVRITAIKQRKLCTCNVILYQEVVDVVFSCVQINITNVLFS